MNIMHIGDLHIGKEVNGYSMIEDQKYILNQIISILKSERIELLLIAGDIYDRAIPSIVAIEVLDEFLTKVVNLNINIAIVSGNHDSSERIGFCSNLLKYNGLYINSDIKKCGEYISLNDEYGEVRVYLIPFFKPADVRYLYKNESIKTFDNAMTEILKNIEIDKNIRNILVTHHLVMGNSSIEFSDSEEKIFVGGIENINPKCFCDFDYVALGHIHKAQKVSKENIRYSGSPLKYSLSEINYKKSVTIIRLFDKNILDIKQIELKPMKDMIKIEGTLNELISDEFLKNVSNINDYIFVNLTDDNELLNPLNILKTKYPNIMSLSFEKNNKRLEDFNLTENIKVREPLDLIENFYKKVTGNEFDDKKRKFIENILDEVRFD